MLFHAHLYRLLLWKQYKAAESLCLYPCQIRPVEQLHRNSLKPHLLDAAVVNLAMP